MSTSEGAAPVAGEQQHLAWCSAVPSGGWKARCSCGYESDTFYDVATASAYADAHREGAAPPDPKPAQGDPQPAEQQECGTCGGSQSSCPVCHPDDSYERHELAAGRGPAERAPEGGERACIECGRLFSTRNPRHRLCFDCLHAAAPEQDAEPGGVAFWRAEVAAAPAEAQQPVAWLVAGSELKQESCRCVTDNAIRAEFYRRNGWTVTPLVPQRATPQPSEEA